MKKWSKKKKIIVIGSIVVGVCIFICITHFMLNSIAHGGAGTLNELGDGDFKSYDAAPAAEPAAEAFNDMMTEDASVQEYSDSEVNGEVGMNEASRSDQPVNTNVTFDEDRKIIYHADVTLETLDYKKTYASLLDIINKYAGYIQSENYTNDSGSYLNADDRQYGLNIYGQNTICIRIPRKNYASFMEDGMALGNVISRTQSVEDQTANYATNQSYIDILKSKIDYYTSQMNKLDSEMDKAIEDNDTARFEEILRDMEYMASMKADVESQMIPYKQHNDSIDELVSYATINMSIREVKEYTKLEVPMHELTFGERVSKAFDTAMARFISWIENIVILLIAILPVLMLLAIPAVIAFAIWLIARKVSKKKLLNAVKEQVSNDIAAGTINVDINHTDQNSDSYSE